MSHFVRGTAYWASVYQPNTTYEPKYCVDLIVDKEGKEYVESLGIKTKEDQERGGFLVKFSRKYQKDDGTLQPKPEVVDAGADPTDVPIGNGSEVIVQFHPFAWAYGGKKGVKAILDGVQIVKLVEYKAGFQPIDPMDEIDKKEQPTSNTVDESLPDAAEL